MIFHRSGVWSSTQPVSVMVPNGISGRLSGHVTLASRLEGGGKHHAYYLEVKVLSETPQCSPQGRVVGCILVAVRECPSQK